jgi:hypothetical protein
MDDADREAAVAVLTDVIAAEATPPDERAVAQFSLGQVLMATLLPPGLLLLNPEAADTAPDVTVLCAAMALGSAAGSPGRRGRAMATLSHLRAAADSGMLGELARRTAEAELTLLTLLLQEPVAGKPGHIDAVADTVRRLRELLAEPSLVGAGRLRHAAGLGGLLLHELTGDEQMLDRAIADLEDAYWAQPTGAGLASTGRLLRMLRRAYRHRVRRHSTPAPEDIQAATDAGLAAVVEDIGTVLLHDGAGAALRSARAVGRLAQDLALDSLAEENPEAALAALELGRGLVTWVATAAVGLPELLDREGLPELAAEWRAGRDRTQALPAPAEAVAVLQAIGPELAGTTTDLRLRTLDALAGTAVGRALLSACDAGDVAGALRATGRDALVYLMCGDADRSGWALIVTAGGALRSVELPALRTGRGGPLDEFVGPVAPDALATDPLAFEELSRWAGLAVLGPVLARLPGDEPRLTLVPCGSLAAVPWSAAVVHTATGSGTRACQAATWSYAATARQIIDLAGRTRSAAPTGPVLLRDPATTAEGVPRRLPGGVVVLSDGRPAVPTSAYDESLTTGTAVVAAGAAGVVAALWTVPDGPRSVLTHVLLERLQHGDPPDLALGTTQRWMLDKHRTVPDGFPAALAEVARSEELADPTVWAAFTCRG